MSLADFKQWDVWVKSMDLAEAVYVAAKLMPKQEEYRLTARLIRAAISAPANIAEGRPRASRREYAHHVSISRGSLAEVETLLLAGRTKLLADQTTRPLLATADQIGRMLSRLHARLAEPATP